MLFEHSVKSLSANEYMLLFLQFRCTIFLCTFSLSFGACFDRDVVCVLLFVNCFSSCLWCSTTLLFIYTNIRSFNHSSVLHSVRLLCTCSSFLLFQTLRTVNQRGPLNQHPPQYTKVSTRNMCVCVWGIGVKPM